MFKTLKNEKGIALVIALVILAALTLMGTAAILTSTLDMQIAGNERTGIQAQYAAEAGLGEAIGRLNLTVGDTRYIGPVQSQFTPAAWPISWENNVNTNANPYMNWARGFSGQIKSTDNKTFFNYSVTLRFKSLGTYNVAFYNKTSSYTKSPYSNGGQPIYNVESTGSYKDYRSTVVLELTRDVYDYNVKGGVSANGSLQIKGAPRIDGRNYNENGTALGGSCSFTNLTGTKPSAYTEGTVTTFGGGNITNLKPAAAENQPYAPQYPWDVLGLDQTQFDSVFTNVQSPSYTGVVKDELYIKGLGDFKRNMGTGVGILVVHNPNFVPGVCNRGEWDGAADDDAGSAADDCAPSKKPASLEFSGTYTFKGIIIGDEINLTGDSTVIGAAISLTTIMAEQTMAGTPQILYSCEAIERYAGGKVKRKLTWNVKR